jgi:exodeoxyribonuclease V alpha subunit
MTALAEPLAEFLVRQNRQDSPALRQATRALCTALAEGHVCLPASKLGVSVEELLAESSIVGTPGEFRPIIADGDRFYFSRYWQYETKLAEQLRARARLEDPPPDPLTLFRVKKLTTDTAQQAAIASALQRRLCIITGGPGTGKTRTATIALTLLAEQFGITPPQIALAAPTGKAAARLSAAMANTLSQIDLQPAVRERLKQPAATLHRLLGAVPGETRFRYHRERPHPADVLVVDEASMIDLPLMCKLLEALRPEARLLLLGDRDQLASVEAGHVLGDMCASTLLEKCVTELTTNHRFMTNSAIQQLASAVNRGDLVASRTILSSQSSELSASPLPRPMAGALREPLIAGWKAVLNARTPAEALERLSDFRILCAVREGPQGVTSINRICEQLLASERLIAPSGSQYVGRPLLILRNDYQLRLFNGDIGIIRRDEETRQLRAYFPGDDGVPRNFAPARLPEHETAFAMTVHKAQGSEFQSVLVILPEAESPVLTRELLYTAITRARRQVELWWTEKAVSTALSRTVVRWSGLTDRLRA